MTQEGELLWTPSAKWRENARVTHLMQWLAANRAHTFTTYDELWRWSVDDLEGFWSGIAEWLRIRWQQPSQRALGDAAMPGAEWFPGGRLNYAEHVLYPAGASTDKDEVAVVFAREDGLRRTLTWRELRTQVAAVRAWLVSHGVGEGDRVAALLPNCPEALVAMLATTSLGAIWSSCSPDFGPRAIADRFTQIEPVVLFAVDGYHYGGKAVDVMPTLRALHGDLPTVRAVVLLSYLSPAASMEESVSWESVLTTPGELAFTYVPFDAPLWILYSSGTTGLPKPIVHGHGGILLEHVKQLALHLDLGPGDRFFWFSTTGWMMWNLLVSGLAVGSAIVLYDGNPAYPGPDALWRLAEEVGITSFGVSAPYIQACMKADLHPGRDFDLTALRSVGSTGAPLAPEGFAWIYDEVGGDVMLSSLSGGTDVCTAFVGGVPLLPVRAGEIPCRLLGCRVEAYDDHAHAVVGEVGELVITAPMPSMPVMFWNDPDRARLREAYFETYPGVWRHGDWIKFTDEGSCVIYGRSDSTLNRGGVRMGTSEFYRVVEELADVEDSLVIDTSAAGVEGRLLLFVVLREGASLDDVSTELRQRIRSQLSPRHVPDEITAIPEVPRTLNGKKCEVPVKRVLAGVPLEKAVSEGALKNPASMQPFLAG
ncbi:MAG TPA: acetoacetate--CoA ligase [Mycobacteriales bacterium]|jgi:acetoacetyl-CoA synthetase|nr:acetoacetate--CoA ligase [Mycobacteriales bacterium]